MLSEINNYIINFSKMCINNIISHYNKNYKDILQNYYKNFDTDQLAVKICIVAWLFYVVITLLNNLLVFVLAFMSYIALLFYPLTAAYNLLEVISILSSILVLTIAFIVGNKFIEAIDSQFIKLKNDLNEKNKENEGLKKILSENNINYEPNGYTELICSMDINM
jgi:hypothetical protein